MENGQNPDFSDLALFLDENPNPVLCISRDGTLLYANRGSGLLLEQWNVRVGQTVPKDWTDTVRETLDDLKQREVEIRIGLKTLQLNIVPISDRGYVSMYGMDVTRRRYIEERLRLNAQVLEHATEAIMITDTEFRVHEVNKAFCSITGYAREEILGESVMALCSGPQENGLYEGIWDTVRNRGSWRGELWQRKKNGEVYPQWLSVSAVADERGEINRFVAIFSDITPMKKTEAQLYRLAHYDSLTGLANRSHFLDLLSRALKNARRKKETLAVLFIDLDSFKAVNDILGHRAGDQLLQETAKRIQRCVRETDTVARMGGDEFTIILSNLQSSEKVAPIAHKLIQRIAEPVVIERREVRVTSSIGIALLADDAADPDRLIQNADLAMYRAKSRGKNGFQFF